MAEKILIFLFLELILILIQMIILLLNIDFYKINVINNHHFNKFYHIDLLIIVFLNHNFLIYKILMEMIKILFI